MADEVDRLEVVVEAQASKANKQLDSLVTKLDKMSGSLSKLNSSGLTGLANSVSKLSTAMQSMNNVKTTDFTRLAKNIGKLGSLNTASFYQSASAINTIAKAYANLGKSVSGVGNLTSVKAPSVKAVKVTTASTGASTLSTVSSQATKASSSLKSLSGRLSDYTSATNRASDGSKSLAYYLGKMYASYYLVIRATKELSNAIMSSMNYIEQYNYFNVTFGKIASEWSDNWQKYGYESADAYGSSFKDRVTDTLSKMTGFQMNNNGTLTDTKSSNLGLDITALTNYSASLMQVTNSLGLTGEASTATSRAMTMLSGDMSSFRNVDLKTVQTNFQSGLIGQSRALYKYGIDITNATLQQYAYNMGITKSITTMTQGEKMQLRMIAILDQSKVAYGDLANTINSPANQVRLLQNNFTALARTIGNMFLPMVATVLPYINGLVLAIRRLFEWTASIMGIDLSGIISNSSAGYSDAFSDIADDADSASDAINGTSDSAKALQNQLMGFDEINKLSDSTSGSSSSAAGAGSTLDLTDQLTGALADYQKVWDNAFNGMNNTALGYADNIVGFFKGIAKYAEPSVDAVKHLWNDGLSKFGKFSYDAEIGFLDNFLIPLGKWTLGSGFPRLVNTTNDFLNNINWDELTRQVDALWNALEPFAETIGSGLLDFYEFALVPVLSNAMNSIVIPYLDNLAYGIDGLNEVCKNASPVFKEFYEGFLVPIGKFVGDIINKFLTTFRENVEKLQTELDGSEAFVDLLNILEHLEPAFKFCLGVAEKWYSKMIEIANGTVFLIIKEQLKNVFDVLGLISAIMDGDLADAWEHLKNLWLDNKLETISSLTSGLKDRVNELKDAWNSMNAYVVNRTVQFVIELPNTWNNLHQYYDEMVNNFVGRVIDFSINISTTVGDIGHFINSIIDSINESVIAKLNFSIEAPSWLGGGTFDFGIPEIPRFAGGGFPDMGEVFIAREAGPEMVGTMPGGRTAVANNDQITTGIASAVREAIVPVFMAMGSQSSNQAPIVEFTWVTDNETMYQKFAAGKQSSDGRYKIYGTI